MGFIWVITPRTRLDVQHTAYHLFVLGYTLEMLKVLLEDGWLDVNNCYDHLEIVVNYQVCCSFLKYRLGRS